MEDENQITVAALKYLTCESEKLCRLCFSSTNDSDACLDDIIKVERSYIDETISYTDMFKDLSVPSEPSLPQDLCTECATMTVNAYSFQKLCQYSNDRWNITLSKLTKLYQTHFVQPHVNTLYLMVKDSETVILPSHKHVTPKSKKSVICKIKQILKEKQVNRKVSQRNPLKSASDNQERIPVKYKQKEHTKYRLNMRYPCSQCPKAFATPSQLAIHAERIHYPKKIHCPKCSKRFSTQKMLKYHDKFHHQATICPLCYKQLPSKKELRQHLDKHETLKCPQCSKTFINRQTFKFHVKTCGNTNKGPNFFCDICNKGYLRKNGIRTHLKTEHGFANVLSCNWCGKKYDAISKLRLHEVKHTKEKKFHCEHCGGKFVTQAALVYHTRLHTGEKPYPCDLCNESFLNASRRMDHKRRKHLEPSHECSVCHVKFVTGNQLKLHLQRHYNPQSKLYVPEADYYRNNSFLQLTQNFV